MRGNTEMTIQELYELLSKHLDDMEVRHTKQLDDMEVRHTKQLDDMAARYTQQLNELDVRHTQRLNEMDTRLTERLNEMEARHTQRLDDIDERLRGVETGIAELQGRKAGFSVLKDWIVASCAVAALIVSIIALTN
ncbi:hypothetical protein C6503_11590 [Candidatus Poribacteria bacterium]|nr:MAG: hypothetical protein C6503_11590 [Candidatus Poribacteria bacterium]